MHTPESIVVSLDWAKKLAAAGFPQNATYFHHSTTGDEQSNHSIGPELEPEHPNFKSPFYTTWAAPTFEEIIDTIRDPEDLMLNNIEIKGKWYQQHVHWDFFSLIGLEDEDDIHKQFSRDIRHDTWADLAAEYWIYLADNKLISDQ